MTRTSRGPLVTAELIVVYC